MGMRIRPPGVHWASQARGIEGSAQVAMIRSKGARPGTPRVPSPVTTTGRCPAAARCCRADSVISGSRSTVVTRSSSPSRWASRAALKPVPVPISRTRSPSSTASEASISAMSEGWLLEETSSPSRSRVASGTSS
jgi:hypothetical protein